MSMPHKKVSLDLQVPAEMKLQHLAVTQCLTHGIDQSKERVSNLVGYYKKI